MKRRLVAAVLTLALAAAANAKEITGLEVCGTDGCRAVSVPSGLFSASRPVKPVGGIEESSFDGPLVGGSLLVASALGLAGLLFVQRSRRPRAATA